MPSRKRLMRILTALERFAASVDIVTYEFENVPTSALDTLEAHCAIRPGREALRISQDRLTEKDFLADLGLRTAPYADVTDAASLEAAIAQVGLPAILKTRRFGYDGKGQVRLTRDSESASALDAVQNAPCILEGHVDFSIEISVIAARDTSGRVAAFDPGQNLHGDGILRRTEVPAHIPPALRTDAVLLAGRILNALEYIGVMGVELFVTRDGLIVNEIAPRVHNSGHWTQNGCSVDQFEQHIRAITGWPLGDGTRFADVVMENLIGSDVERLSDLAQDPRAAIHLYGKSEVKAGRKMGHVNFVSPLT